MAVFMDGTSNTVAFAECVMAPPGGTRLIKGGLGFPQSGGYTAAICLATATGKEYNGTGINNGDAQSGNGYYLTDSDSIGKKWCDGLAVQCVFHTILPPNSPSCARGSQNYPSSGAAMIAATSSHTGGVNVALGDGAVRFVTDAVDAGTERSLNVTASLTVSKSPYGVWGAMGSVNGGESVSAP